MTSSVRALVICLGFYCVKSGFGRLCPPFATPFCALRASYIAIVRKTRGTPTYLTLVSNHGAGLPPVLGFRLLACCIPDNEYLLTRLWRLLWLWLHDSRTIETGTCARGGETVYAVCASGALTSSLRSYVITADGDDWICLLDGVGRGCAVVGTGHDVCRSWTPLSKGSNSQRPKSDAGLAEGACHVRPGCSRELFGMDVLLLEPLAIDVPVASLNGERLS